MGFIIPLFLIIWLRNPFFYEYGGLTREYTAYLYCIFFYCFHLRKNIGWLAFIAGIVFINQQNEILPLLPFIFYSLIQNKEYSLGNIFKLIFCFIVPFLLISGWLMANNGFTEFIDQAFKFNFQYYTQLKIRNIAYSIVTIFTKYPFLMLGILMLYYQLIWVKNRKLVFTLSLSIFACFYNIFISGRLYGHYFLPLGPILVYTSIVLMHETHQTKLKTNYIIVALLICSFSIIWQNRAFNLNQQIAIAKKQNSTNSQIKNEIQKGLGNIDKIYFINTSAGLYFNTLYEKMPPSKYVYFSIWDEIPMWDKDLKEFKGILNSMKRQRTLVFDFTVNKPFNRAMMNEQLSKLLKINFKKIGRIENNEGQILFNIYSNISAEGHD